MTDYGVKMLAEVLALQCEMEGMKANNKMDEHYDSPPQHNSNEFEQIADKLRAIVHEMSSQS